MSCAFPEGQKPSLATTLWKGDDDNHHLLHFKPLMGPAMGKIKVKEGYGNRTGNKHSAINLEILTRDQKAVIKSSTEVPQY